MSADNYALIRELPDGRWLVTNESASRPTIKRRPTEQDMRRGSVVNTLASAFELVDGDYYEYGPDVLRLDEQEVR